MIQRLGLARAYGPVAALVLGLIAAGAVSAFAQEDDSRVRRLERDVRDLQQEVYRSTGGAPRQVAQADDFPGAAAAPMTQRVSDLEGTVQRLTGEVEELQNQNRVLQTKVDRLQRALDYQQNGGAAAPATSPSDNMNGGGNANGGGGDESFQGGEPPPAHPARSSAGEGLAPGPANLGSLPANTPMPVAKPGGNAGASTAAAAPAATTTTTTTSTRVASLPPSTGSAQGDYDAAMALLRKAQYAAAQQAFRAFADAHPTDPHAADALFWTGDIAYSASHDYNAASRAFAELLKKYAKAGRAPEGMLKLGLSLLALGQKEKGCAILAALPVQYAKGPPALLTRAVTERKRAACT